MKICEIHWKQTIPIRHQVLWPQEAPEFCHVTGDDQALHFGVYLDSELVSVASIYIENETARLRKFATLNMQQGKGIGSKLLKHILDDLRSKDITYFWCDARETALDFYKRFGLSPEGEKFYKSNIPYYRMSCELSSTGNNG